MRDSRILGKAFVNSLYTVKMCGPGRYRKALFHNHWEEALMSVFLPAFGCRLHNSNNHCSDMGMQSEHQVYSLFGASCSLYVMVVA